MAGFEPAVRLIQEYDGLANRWFKPTHPHQQFFALRSQRPQEDSNPRAGFPASRFSKPTPSARLGYAGIWRCTQDSNLQIISDQRFSGPLPYLFGCTAYRTIKFQKTITCVHVFCMAGATGFEPVLMVLETTILPLNDTPVNT